MNLLRPAPAFAIALVSFGMIWSPVSGQEEQPALPEGLAFERGPINAAWIERGGERAQFYRVEEGGGALHFVANQRRDLVEAGRPGIGADTRVFAPAGSVELLGDPDGRFWQPWWEERFDYYGQQVTRIPLSPVGIERGLADGDHVEWQGLTFRAVKTTGYTREGTSYLVEIDGRKIAFTGDLIQAGGRVADLYSFQDSIPEAKVGAYHGYGARFAQWIVSLEKIAAESPDLLVPARGPLVTDPAGDIAKAIRRVRKIYRNYLSTNSLHWYFGEERMAACAERVLGPDHGVEAMPFAERRDMPEWCLHIGTTKLLMSEDGTGFVLDVGGDMPLRTLRTTMEEGPVERIEGLYVTHTHNDHTQRVREAAEAFDCPVYADPLVADVLADPGAWFLPGVSNNPVSGIQAMEDGAVLEWKEYRFTFRFFPGQMLNHGALLVEKEGEDPVFFIGDSFSPSGLDDYCAMNRNLMREDSGYLLCLEKLRALPEGTWLVNQHIPHLFRFTPEELDHLESRYQERRDLLAELFPWDDVNYGLDEQWAWFHPYGQEVKRGGEFRIELRLSNHSRKRRTFAVEMEPAEGIRWLDGGRGEVALEAREEGTVELRGRVDAEAGAGVHVLAASIRSGDDIDLDHWIEALVKALAE